MEAFDKLHIPYFENFIREPNNKTCVQIDSTRLMVEILGGLKSSSLEFDESSYSSKIILDGKYSLVIRYRREKEGIYRPACILGFDIDNDYNICINQLQGSNDKRIAFRFFSSFDNISFYLKLIEESFSSRGIYVYLKDFPECLEFASPSSRAIHNYDILRKGLHSLNVKYNLC